ncbi:MAG: mandelate racemase, partial [Phycisphaerae bacterium]|nr:mandelate racemase [Phycisphaerae bacterium]
GAYDLKYPAALNGPQFLATRTILKQPLTAVGGEMSVPTGPGLGVEVDEDKVREYAVKNLCG